MKYSANQIKDAIQEILENYDSDNNNLNMNNIDFNQDIYGIALGLVIFRGYILNISFTNYRILPGQHINHLDPTVPDIETKLIIEPTDTKMSLNKPDKVIIFNSYDSSNIDDAIYKILNTTTNNILTSRSIPLDLSYTPFSQLYSMAIGLIISRGYMTNLSLSNNQLGYNTFMINIGHSIYEKGNTIISIGSELSSKGHIFINEHIKN